MLIMLNFLNNYGNPTAVLFLAGFLKNSMSTTLMEGAFREGMQERNLTVRSNLLSCNEENGLV